MTRPERTARASIVDGSNGVRDESSRAGGSPLQDRHSPGPVNANRNVMRPNRCGPQFGTCMSQMRANSGHILRPCEREQVTQVHCLKDSRRAVTQRIYHARFLIR